MGGGDGVWRCGVVMRGVSRGLAAPRPPHFEHGKLATPPALEHAGTERFIVTASSRTSSF